MDILISSNLEPDLSDYRRKEVRPADMKQLKEEGKYGSATEKEIIRFLRFW